MTHPHPDSPSYSTLVAHSSTSTNNTNTPSSSSSSTTLRSRSKSIITTPTPPSFSSFQSLPAQNTSNPSSSSLISMLLSPRSSNYERLEGGHGPARLAKRKFTWHKFLIAACVIIGLVWLFGPRKEDLKNKVPWGNDSGTVNEDDGDSGRPTHPYIPPPPQTHTPSSHSTPTSEKPLTFSTDPNRASTPYCTTPHPSKSTLIQWSLMIDAGSTGSRIHIYKFNNCNPSPTYEYEVFVKNQKGLSSFKGRPLEAAMSLDPLLDEATNVVPKEMWSCTPVYVRATAGLRLLGEEGAKQILDGVEGRLKTFYPFSVPDGAVGVMEGKDEGVYAWITANYLLGTIGSGQDADGKGKDKDKAKETYAVLDLGGASTQIVFKPEFGDTKSDKGLEEGEHKYDLKFGGEAYVLYQHSYLGYGLMQARRHTHALVEFMDSIRPGAEKKGGDKRRVPNPCLARGTEREVEYFDETRGKDGKVVMYGGDVGSFEACERVMALVLAKDAICETKPCSFNGVYQPSLLDTFKHGKVLLLSYFYDRIEPLLALLLSPSSPPFTPTLDNLPISTLTTLATHLCAGLPGWTTAGWTRSPRLVAELEDRPEWCLDMTFMHALLRLGYEFGDERQVRVGKGVGGTELGWCLGAAISALDGEVSCRV